MTGVTEMVRVYSRFLYLFHSSLVLNCLNLIDNAIITPVGQTVEINVSGEFNFKAHHSSVNIRSLSEH